MKKQITTSIVLTALAVAVPVAAQDAPRAPEQQAQPPAMIAVPDPVPAPPAAVAQKPINLAEIRHHIYVMEGALARAVDYGAKQLNREIVAVMPGVFMLEGEARARGVHLENYGVFFDVRVPMMRQSMAWSLQQMIYQKDDAANRAAVAELRGSLDGVTNPSTRASILKAISQIERQTSAPAASNQPVSPGVMVSEPPNAAGGGTVTGLSTVRSAPIPSDSIWAKDPNRAYTEAVTRALVDAMIDYSTPMNIPADQWLTVAARDDEGRDVLAPQDPLEEVVTMIYRIKGSDLQLYRTGKIDRDEVRKRVQVTQF
ncbi:MAG TPA: hypothetical protein VM096_00430 [Vicinamibacterales bacterium]|nr:hypothetical protein [Vicinamibacterales bacterium]